MRAKINKIFRKMEDTSKESPNPAVEQEQTQVSNTIENNDSTAEEAELPQAESSPVAKLEEQLAELNDKYLRLFSDFDNYRKRTAKERIELAKTAGEDIFKAILPVLDDFERGLKAMNEAADVTALKEGVDLIFNKLNNTLASKGLEPLTSVGVAFDTDIHEAITNIPAPSEEMKGKVIDELERGYALNGKVIRYAKVIVGN
ncbi:MAG TPA: nucleotide exchange factor GrpE [Bacteroidia bacterium]|nr:nucleotide exchange factor GrpE [Bacteroidia bacterium]